MRVNTNISSIAAQTTMRKTNRGLEESLAKLSSGERITKAADDAAGLAISERMDAEVRSSKQANRNANDGISLVQVAEGALNETSAMLIRLRELAMQASSDTVGDAERAKSDLEYQQVKAEIERIAQVTEFNGRKLLNGSGTTLTFQVGTGVHSADDVIAVRPQDVNGTLTSLGISGESVRGRASAQMSLGNIDRAINKVNAQRSTLGSIQNRLQSSSNNLGIYTENISAGYSRIRDVDYAEETANKARGSIALEAGVAVTAQANTSPQAALRLIS